MKALLIDYGSGNLRSAAKALEVAGFEVVVSSDPKAHLEASLLVLPGQGHFGQVMRAFRDSGFVERVLAHVEKGLPFLGICVGMQVLYGGSEEAPGVQGLGLVEGVVRRFTAGRGAPDGLEPGALPKIFRQPFRTALLLRKLLLWSPHPFLPGPGGVRGHSLYRPFGQGKPPRSPVPPGEERQGRAGLFYP